MDELTADGWKMDGLTWMSWKEDGEMELRRTGELTEDECEVDKRS